MGLRNLSPSYTGETGNVDMKKIPMKLIIRFFAIINNTHNYDLLVLDKVH